ncbi:MAG: hypothetical protein FWF12_07540 [Betaproteobacteria bacterium]|nr:hypothetical protein [Betaproteobacteria bacterium]
MEKSRFSVKKVVKVALLVAVASVVVVSGNASASATGVATWGGFTTSIKGIPVPIKNGVLIHQISGSGRNYTHQKAQAQSPLICYGRIDFVELGVGDKEISRSKGSESAGCVKFAITRQRNNGKFGSNVRKACAQFYVNGVSKARQCHSIY